MPQSAVMRNSTTSSIFSIADNAVDFPELLRCIPDPPKELFVLGTRKALHDLLQRPRVAVVGSRKLSSYGRVVTMQLAGELARAGVVIVSGLAIGVDAVAHHAALEAGGLTLGVLAGGLDYIHPTSNQQLAEQIVQQGGVLLSEYPVGIPSYPQQFIARNRIVSGISHAVLITEAAEKSGTLHTARFALEQGRDVLAVPGNITSPGSVGVNNLIKTGATPVTCTQDVLHALGIESRARKKIVKGATPEEQLILDLLAAGESDGDQLQQLSKLNIQAFNQHLTMLEISGKIRSLGANTWTLP
jgi:DNA processing protein